MFTFGEDMVFSRGLSWGFGLFFYFCVLLGVLGLCGSGGSVELFEKR